MKNNSGSIQNKKKRSTRKNDHTRNIKIYMVWSQTYIHGQCQGECFTRKIRRLQEWHTSITKPKPKYTQRALSQNVDNRKKSSWCHSCNLLKFKPHNNKEQKKELHQPLQDGEMHHIDPQISWRRQHTKSEYP